MRHLRGCNCRLEDSVRFAFRDNCEILSLNPCRDNHLGRLFKLSRKRIQRSWLRFTLFGSNHTTEHKCSDVGVQFRLSNECG